MNRFCSFRFLPGIALLQVALALGCARPKPAAPPPVDQTTRLCAAIGQGVPLEIRFAGILPLEQGGFIATLSGTNQAEVEGALGRFGLLGVNLTTCGSNLVLFIPAITISGAENLERALRAQVPSLQVKERVRVPPKAAPSKPRSTSN
jgi:hypothetical protein